MDVIVPHFFISVVLINQGSVWHSFKYVVFLLILRLQVLFIEEFQFEPFLVVPALNSHENDHYDTLKHEVAEILSLVDIYEYCSDEPQNDSVCDEKPAVDAKYFEVYYVECHPKIVVPIIQVS